ncbi:MAG: O-antigen ligase family protein [Candidatus Melainabacteria bacterium]|nr:O-antigen ligase family protein [Candidatus Melainabacteria bacterium]
MTQLLDSIACLVSLKSQDDKLKNALQESISGNVIAWPFRFLSKSFAKLEKAGLAKFGTLMQNLAFIVTALMIFSLWLPVFASDKEILAIISLLSLFLFVGGSILGGSQKRQISAIDAVVVFFFGINVVAAFASRYFEPSLKGLAKLVIYVSSYFLFSAVANTPKRRLILMIAAVAGGLIAAIYGLYQYKIGVAPLATWEDPSVESQATRIYSTLGNPNLLAGYLIPLVSISGSMLIASIDARRWIFSIITAPVCLTLIAATLLTGSRGGFMGIAMALATLFLISSGWCWRKYPKTRPVVISLAIVLPLIAGACVFLVPSMQQRVVSIFAGWQHSSNAFRLHVYESSMHMLKDNWWIGVGTGNQAFRMAYGLYMNSRFDALGTYCVPLEIAVEAGIFALTTFAVFFVALLGRAHSAFYNKTIGWERWLCAGMASALFGIAAMGFVDTVFYRPQVHFIFWLLAGTLVTASIQSSAQKRGDDSNEVGS